MQREQAGSYSCWQLEQAHSSGGRAAQGQRDVGERERRGAVRGDASCGTRPPPGVSRGSDPCACRGSSLPRPVELALPVVAVAAKAVLVRLAGAVAAELAVLLQRSDRSLPEGGDRRLCQRDQPETRRRKRRRRSRSTQLAVGTEREVLSRVDAPVAVRARRLTRGTGAPFHIAKRWCVYFRISRVSTGWQLYRRLESPGGKPE